MIHKNRYNRRKQNYYKAKRKVDILRNVFELEEKWIKPVNAYSKDSIHSSYGVYIEKSKHIGDLKYNRPNTWKVSDRRKFNNCDQKIKEYVSNNI